MYVRCSLLALLVCSAVAQTPPKANVTVMVPMRDGVRLATLINFPASYKPGISKHTTVLDRSPYGPDFIAPLAEQFLSQGHVAIRQMIRGTNASEGNFELWHDCVDDGYDAIEWIVSQPWSDGRVFVCGTSADAIDAQAQMPSPHPAIKAQYLQFGGTNGWDNFFPGGAFRLAFIETWVSNNVPYNVTGEITAVALHEGPGSWWDMLNSTDGDAFFGSVTWPTISASGWYDIILKVGVVCAESHGQNQILNAVVCC